jgi:hypothetical protein
MTNEDRDILLSLRQQQSELQQMLERIASQLVALERRADTAARPIELPPVPPEAFLPPIPPPAPEIVLPPIPVATAPIDLPPIPGARKPSYESHAGRWLMRLGGAFLVLAFVLCASWADLQFHLHNRLGAGGKVALLGLISVVILVIGQRFERHSGGRFYFGRMLVVTGLLALFFTGCCATYNEGMRVVGPIAGGVLLVLASIYALFLAQRAKSQSLGVLGITLGYVSTAINANTHFSMGTDLILTATGAAFLLRNGWTTLAAFSALGTYFAMFRRLVFDSSGDLVLDTSRTLPFLPPAIYLIGAWTLFTAAAILTLSPAFRGGKRLFFVSLNNASLAFLLALTAYIAGYGVANIGWTLFDTGVVFLVVSRFAGFAETDPVDLMGAYAAQGLALFTAGIIVVFTGITRAFLLLLETLLLGIAGAFAGDRILTISTYAAGFFATLFSVWQIALYAHHPWLLGLGGALIMLINAWSSRGEVRYSPIARSSIVFSTSCYCLLALGLIFAAFSTELSDAALPVALAIGAVVLTFSIYHFSIYELPSLAQVLMLGALILVLFPVETGEELPGWTIGWVGLSTLVLVTWWSRQRLTRPGPWIGPVTFLYALALVYLAVLTVRPYLDAQGWMVAASLLSALFLAYGALSRVWSVALAGQVLLLLSLYHFFFPPQSEVFPWAAWAAAVPVLVTFLTARAAHQWTHLFPEMSDARRNATNFIGHLYKLIALAGIGRWIFGVVPESSQMAAFLFVATFLLAQNIRRPDAFGARCSLLLSAIGMSLCFTHRVDLATSLNALAVLLLVLQAPLLGPGGPVQVRRFEGMVLLLAAAATAWYFASIWAWPHLAGTRGHLTLAWAICAFFLFLVGLFSGLRALRWCGLVILFSAILRVLCVDLWGLTSGFRVLTFFLIALISLAIGLSLVWRDDSRKS